MFNRHFLLLNKGLDLDAASLKKLMLYFVLSSEGQKPSSSKMPENANIAKTNHQQPYCSLCLAFALLSTEYAAWPFCSWMPNYSSSTQIIDHVLTTTVEHVIAQKCPLLCKTLPNSQARKECQILASVLPIFWNLTYEMHFGLVCFHLVLSISSTCVQRALNAYVPAVSCNFSNSISFPSSQNRWLMSSRERGE